MGLRGPLRGKEGPGKGREQRKWKKRQERIAPRGKKVKSRRLWRVVLKWDCLMSCNIIVRKTGKVKESL